MSAPFALTNATVLTCDGGGAELPGATVVVDAQGVIEQVGPAAEVVVPRGYRRIDATGRFVLPGLINAHAHLFSDGKPLPPILLKESVESLVAAFMHSPIGRVIAKRRTKANVRTQLHSGVTTLRSLGDVGYEVVEVREEIERGDYAGPRVLASGPLLAVPGGHGAPQIALTSDSPEGARKNTRKNLAKGVTAIKIAATGGVTDARAIGEAGRPQMTEADMTAICEEAHRAGVLVAAHAQSEEGITAALRAGVDTIEHGAAMNAEMIDLFKDNPRSLRGTSALIPTLQPALPLVKLAPEITGADEIVRANAELVFEEMLQGIRDALANDITIGMGTDSALTHVTHYNTWRELDYVVRYGGLTPQQALHAATRENARILGLDGITGSIEAGKHADIVVLGANPLDDFRAFTTPELVIARGTIVERPAVTRFHELDAALDSL
ncbi:amidohydrolase family protein [Saccharopolyspora indica]|uniref:amidohydrolase family protein n=1 Tax=Saccharopolyspora indica TaxID=1229659 RepID=UPI0022EB9826|nr:amidohydrolase family protein [Saccharopolyspora indica]MDA3646437.1 amidohydrolase family protein [Saccharopolyspora indica]